MDQFLPALFHQFLAVLHLGAQHAYFLERLAVAELQLLQVVDLVELVFRDDQVTSVHHALWRHAGAAQQGGTGGQAGGVGRRAGGWAGGQTGGWVDGWTDGRTQLSKDNWIDIEMDRWTG